MLLKKFLVNKNIFLFVFSVASLILSLTAHAEGNSISTATSINLSESFDGLINPAGDVDYYQVNIGASGGLLHAYTTGSRDTYGDLLDNTGAVIASNDDGGAGTNFNIQRTVAAGIYYMRVRFYSRYQAGAYTLQVDCAGCSAGSGTVTPPVVTPPVVTPPVVTPPVVDPSLFPSAVTVALNSSTNGQIDSAGDVNYYLINIGETGGALNVYTTGSRDTYGDLLSSTGAVITSNDDGGAGTNFNIQRTVAAGIYYLRVRFYSRYQSGVYTLQVDCAGCSAGSGTVTPPVVTPPVITPPVVTPPVVTPPVVTPPVVDPTLFPSAVTVSLNSSTNGQINSAGDVNYYLINIGGAGGALNIYTTGSRDTYGDLLSSTGTVITSNDDGGAGTNFNIQRTVAAGIYYLRVRFYSRYQAGDYTLQVDCAGCSAGSGTVTPPVVTPPVVTPPVVTPPVVTPPVVTPPVVTPPVVTPPSGNSQNWNVPFLKQHDYAYINEAAATATSIAMILRFYYPDSAADPRVVYHSGLESYLYVNGLASDYSNVRRNTTTGALVLDHVPTASHNVYSASAAGTVIEKIDNYLARVWEVETATVGSVDSVYAAIQSGPILANVRGPSNSFYSNQHYIVIRGIDTNGTTGRTDDYIVINDPYDTQWSNSNVSGNGRRIAYQEFFSSWFYQGIKLVPSDTSNQRSHTVVVDTGNNNMSGVSAVHEFSVDEPQAWLFSYLDGDWYTSYFPNGAEWKPRLIGAGRYEITTSFKGIWQGAGLVYKVVDHNGQVLHSALVSHGFRDSTWERQTIVDSVYLQNGAKVRIDFVNAGTPIDSVKFKYLGD